MSVESSSIKKGETLLDTAMTLNAMHPDVLVVRHPESGAVKLLSEKVNCAVINGGDGAHEHPTQALLDARHHPPAQGPPPGADRRDLRRHPAQPGGALEHLPAPDDGRAGPRGRPADPDAAPGRAARRRGLLGHGEGPQGLRHRDDAPAADRADAGQLRALDPRIFPLLRARLREAVGGQARRADHASRPDEPRRRDRQRGRRRLSAAARSRSRSRWGWPCAWPASIC